MNRILLKFVKEVLSLNPMKVFTQKELEEIMNIGITVKNREYTPEECRRMEFQIEENIMNESKRKIPKLTDTFENILNILIKFQKI